MTIRVIIADDQELVRAGFTVLVNAVPDMEVVAVAGTGEEAVAVVRQHRPDVVLMDVRMPVMDGIEATRTLLGEAAEKLPRVIILTTFDLDDYVFPALRAGASGFLLKDAPPEQLLAAIRTVFAGESLLAPSVTRRLIRHVIDQPISAPRPPPPHLDGLTEREREVLYEVATGLSNTDIAERLRISIGTVKTHISRLLAKLGAHDRAQLVVIAYESGLVRQHRVIEG